MESHTLTDEMGNTHIINYYVFTRTTINYKDLQQRVHRPVRECLGVSKTKIILHGKKNSTPRL